eukprot:6208188-Pleurochrysis_carterae.AAC.7
MRCCTPQCWLQCTPLPAGLAGAGTVRVLQEPAAAARAVRPASAAAAAARVAPRLGPVNCQRDSTGP